MANKISVLIDVSVERANQALGNFRKSVGEAEGAVGKFKAGAASAGDSLKANIMPVAAAAGAGMVAFAAKSVQAASTLAESTNAVNVSFGNAAEGVLELGENAAESMGLSQAAFNQAAVGFAAFTETIAGPGGDAANIIDDLTKRSSDFASVMNLDVAEAANVFRSALSGETEPIKKFGIDLSAAAVEAFALASGMVKSKNEMTEAIKVQARYGLLMEETNKFAGDFANTSDGLANSSRIAAARFEDLQAKIGTQLLPVVEDATGLLLGLADAIDAVGNNSIVKFGQNAGLFNNIFGVTKELWDRGPGSLIAMASATDEASESIESSSQAMVQASIDSAFLERKRRDLAAAEEDSAASIDEATEAAKRGTQAIKDAIAAYEDAEEAQRGMQSASLGYRQQVADTAAAIAESTLIQLDAKRTDEEREQAARDAEAAMLAQAEAAVQLAEDQAAAAGQTLSADEKTQAYVEELYTLAATMSGPARAEIEAHIQRLLGIPGSIYTNIGVSRSGDFGPMLKGARASGGPVSAGGAYLVGEKGPEVLQMGSTGGNVIPNGALGGATINLTVNAGLGTNGAQLGRQLVDILEAHYQNGGRPPRSGG